MPTFNLPTYSFWLKKSKFLVLALFFYAYISGSIAQAGCTRDDIDHYLQKGFNHQQVVSLCSENSMQGKPKNRLSPNINHTKSKPHIKQQTTQYQYTKPSKTLVYQEQPTTIPNNPDAIFLATAIEAYDLEISNTAIIFTRKDCFNYGQEDWNEFKSRACPHVKYTINRENFKIVDRDNGFFGLGSTALHITGDISAEILDLNQIKEKYHQEIKAVVENNTDKLQIDVRPGMPQSKVETVLLRVASQR